MPLMVHLQKLIHGTGIASEGGIHCNTYLALEIPFKGAFVAMNIVPGKLHGGGIYCINYKVLEIPLKDSFTATHK